MLLQSPRGSICAAMLPLLMSSIVHAIRVVTRGVRVWRSRWRRCLNREGRSGIIWWGTIANYLVPRVLGLAARRVVVASSVLLLVPVCIRHLIQRRSEYGEALAQMGERKPCSDAEDLRVAVGDLENGIRFLLRWHIGLLRIF